MIMADVFKFLFLILGTLITIVSYWLLFEAFTPKIVERARRVYADRPWKAFIFGLIAVVPGTLLGVAFLNAPNGLIKFAGAILLMALILAGLMGSTGLTRLLGTRLNTPSDDQQPWRRVLRGGTVLSLTFVLPLIGWFVVLPATLITGVGAIVLSRREAKSNAAPAPVDNQLGVAGA